MARFIRKHHREIGASPDDFIFVGDKKTDHVTLRIIDYDKNNLEELQINTVEEAIAYQEKKTTTWFNVDGLDTIDVMP